MGLVTLAIFCHSFNGLVAAITMMLAHGLVSSGLFMCSSILYTRHNTRTIRYFRGLVYIMPLFSILTLFLVLANIGFPLTFNFIAEFLSILTAFQYSKIVGVLCCLGVLISTVYTLYFYNRVFFGSSSSHLNNPRDINHSEFQAFIPLIILTIVLGIYPSFILDYITLSCYKSISL